MLIIRKGRNWEEDFGVAEWIQAEMGEEMEIQVNKTNDRQVFKIWCEGKDTKKKIWEARTKWE